MTDRQHIPVAHVSRRRRAALVVLLVATAGGGLGRWARNPDRTALRWLASATPDERRRAAALAAEGQAPRTVAALAHRLQSRAEPDDGVREAAVHALGRRGPATCFDLVHTLAVSDPDRHVRLAAWTALPRLSPERFRAVASDRTTPADPWESAAIAAAWLELGDTRGVPELLQTAAEAEHPLRGFASRALFNGLAPPLEAVGRWPLEARLSEGDTWPPELAREVARRCHGLDLQALADDLQPHALAAAGVRRDIGRLHGTRARLVRMLGVGE